MRKPTNRKNIGRPRLPADERLTCTVMVRLTEYERVAAEIAADAAGVSLARYARDAMREKREREREKIEREE